MTTKELKKRAMEIICYLSEDNREKANISLTFSIKAYEGIVKLAQTYAALEVEAYKKELESVKYEYEQKLNALTEGHKNPADDPKELF